LPEASNGTLASEEHVGAKLNETQEREEGRAWENEEKRQVVGMDLLRRKKRSTARNSSCGETKGKIV